MRARQLVDLTSVETLYRRAFVGSAHFIFCSQPEKLSGRFWVLVCNRHRLAPPRRDHVVDLHLCGFRMGRRVSMREGFATAAVVVLIGASYYFVTTYRREATRIRLTSADVQQAVDPQVLLKAADRFYFLNNGHAAAPPVWRRRPSRAITLWF